MTLKELALLANVSQSTVSKAFSNAKDISEETREHIFKLAREHHCYEKFHKGNYFKKIIAVICPEIKSETYHRIVTALETHIADIGATMVLSLSHFDSNIEEALYYYHTHYQKVDGIIIIDASANPKEDLSVPVVRIEAEKPSYTNTIDTEKQGAIDDAVKYLLNMGHRKIAFIGERFTPSKLERFRIAMKKWLVPIRNEYIVISEERFDVGGYHCMEKLLALKEPPTAVIAAYDYMALGALKCINDHGFSVPEDISLIGQDDIQLLSFIKPGLTSISIPYEEQCELAIRLLQKKMRNNYYTGAQKTTVNATLVKRNSVKNIKETT